MMRLILIFVVLTGALVSPALAHPGMVQTSSLADGIAHPFNGADHIVTMVAVGLWSVVAGGRAIWMWPMAFVAPMLAGFAAASLGIQMPFVEPAIWSSIIVLGLLVALAVRAPIWIGVATTGIFAFFHGHAHGTEATAASLIPYAAGLAFATAGLHAAGIGLGLFVDGSIGKVALRAMGGLVVLGGVALIVA